MATSIAVSCPKCDTQIKAPPNLVGKKIRCKQCKNVFLVEEPAPEVEAVEPEAAPAKVTKVTKPAKDPRFDRDDKPYNVTETSLLPRCPYCAQELESDEQVVCLNCGYNMQSRERIRSRKTYETTGGDMFLWLLPGIACALASLTMITFIVLTWVLFPRLERENSEVWWSFVFGLAFRIWESVVYLFIGFFTTKFAIKRLVFDHTPPEKIKHK